MVSKDLKHKNTELLRVEHFYYFPKRYPMKIIES